MTIKVSQFVDTSGRVHLPYLNFWKVYMIYDALSSLNPPKSIHVRGCGKYVITIMHGKPWCNCMATVNIELVNQV